MYFISVHKAMSRSQFCIKDTQQPLKNYVQNKFNAQNTLGVYSLNTRFSMSM